MAYKPRNFDVSIGCDPEFFLKRNGKSVSAHGLIGGTKLEPLPLENGAVQLDGTAVEFNILPCYSAVQFASRIKQVLDQIRARIPKDYEFDFSPSVIYDPTYFEKEIPQSSKELGCTPDYDAYRNGAVNDPPKQVGTMRTGSGHIHIGWCDVDDPFLKEHIEDCCSLAKNLDALFTSVEHWWDKDTRRREMYGKPGCFRPKPYGMEYRTPSNAWLKSREIQVFVYNLTMYGFWATASGRDLSRYAEKIDKKTWNRKIGWGNSSIDFFPLWVPSGGGGGYQYLPQCNF